ncbi:MAG TPA: MYG1 family protein [Acetobacteraceae bacterium]
MPPVPTLVTHNGKFHCDEVFAYAVLRHALGVHQPGIDHILVRTRDPGVIGGGDVVWDVGLHFDAAANRFDHHQRGAPERPDGTPFSSAGLVWQSYGRRAVESLLGDGRLAEAVAADLDGGIVRRIDEVDNGVSAGPDKLGLAAMIGDFNPPWDQQRGNPAEDAAFLQAALLADGVLRRRVDQVRARLLAEAEVVAAHAASADPHVLELDRNMPWKNAVFVHGLPVLYAVYPASNGNWMVDTMPPDPASFAQRLPLPETWAGLPEAELPAATGVPDAVFVHLRRFVGAARSRAGAVAMARQSIALAAGAAAEA